MSSSTCAIASANADENAAASAQGSVGVVVTRADVARKAGTSTAVVSYVVNNGPRPVADKTRARVLKAIAQLGYRPNVIAQTLRGHKSHVLGLVLPDIANPFYAELARIIEKVAETAGYTLVLGNSEQDAARELRYMRAFADRKVDGFFLISGSSSRRLSALSSEIDLPHVLLDRSVNYTGRQALLATDGVAGAQIATRHLLSLGHRRIIALCGPEKMGVDRARGYSMAMHDAGLAPQVRHAEKFDRRDAYVAARAILSARDRPTALFASNDVAGLSVLRAAADLAIACPQEIAVVAFDDIQEGQYSVPRLTTVAQPIEELGRLALEQLLALIRDGKDAAPGEMRLIMPKLIVRESCGAALLQRPIKP